MRIIPFIVTLLLVSPAFGQSRVFTNADLGKPLSRGSEVKADQAAAILAPYQFVDVAPREWFLGPTVTVLNSSPTAGPFGEFKDFSPTRRLDGSFLTDPPWSATVSVKSCWASSALSRSASSQPTVIRLNKSRIAYKQ